MSWRVESRTEDRWVETTDDSVRWRADDETTYLMLRSLVLGEEVPLTTTGPSYTPTGTSDELGAYLLALALVPGPVDVTGEPPTTSETVAMSEESVT